eukprot:366463-Chlamydomonas_euryale.AAC.10
MPTALHWPTEEAMHAQQLPAHACATASRCMSNSCKRMHVRQLPARILHNTCLHAVPPTAVDRHPPRQLSAHKQLYMAVALGACSVHAAVYVLMDLHGLLLLPSLPTIAALIAVPTTELPSLPGCLHCINCTAQHLNCLNCFSCLNCSAECLKCLNCYDCNAKCQASNQSSARPQPQDRFQLL